MPNARPLNAAARKLPGDSQDCAVTSLQLILGFRADVGLKVQRRIVYDLLHHEKRSGLPPTGRRDETLPMQALEIRDVAHP
jgi:hypothetical protein